MGRAPGEVAVFPSLLASICDHDDDSMAVRDCNEELTYAELCGRARGCARSIAATAGVDDVVVLLEPSPIEFVCWFIGCLMAGRWVLPTPPDSPDAEIARLIAESNARFGAGDVALHDRHGLQMAAGASDAWSDGGGIVLRTSGTTGIPKLVQRTRASLDAVAANVCEAAGLCAEDVVLAAIPAWHSYGVENVMLGPLAAGCAVEFQKFDPGVCEAAMKTRATVFPGVPMMFEALSRGGRVEAPSLRLGYSAGSSLAPEINGAFFERWGRRVGQLYGATDVGSVTFNDPNDIDFETTGVGAPMRGVSVRIIGEDGEDVGAGEEGQVAIRAPSMLSRYLGPHDMAMEDGHLLMGDLGRLDVAGRLTITGMMKFLIDVGGMKVNPLEVEGVLREHPDVADCAVTPLKVTNAVNRVRAFVTPSMGREIDPAALRAWLKSRLAAHKIPRVIDVCEALPRSATGKLLRRVLEES